MNIQLMINNIGTLPARDIKISLQGLKDSGLELYKDSNLRSIAFIDGKGGAAVSYSLRPLEIVQEGNYGLTAKLEYKDKNGKPIKSKPCLVVYYHEKRMKQLLTKKNSGSISADLRDMKTGLLTGIDKNGKESDREFESLAVSGLMKTAEELSRPRADSMNDKDIMNNIIKNLGQVTLSELPEEVDDSLSKNLLNAYFIGAQLYTNIVEKDTYILPYTAKDKELKINRID